MLVAEPRNCKYTCVTYMQELEMKISAWKNAESGLECAELEMKISLQTP